MSAHSLLLRPARPPLQENAAGDRCQGKSARHLHRAGRGKLPPHPCASICTDKSSRRRAIFPRPPNSENVSGFEHKGRKVRRCPGLHSNQARTNEGPRWSRQQILCGNDRDPNLRSAKPTYRRLRVHVPAPARTSSHDRCAKIPSAMARCDRDILSLSFRAMSPTKPLCCAKLQGNALNDEARISNDEGMTKPQMTEKRF